MDSHLKKQNVSQSTVAHRQRKRDERGAKREGLKLLKQSARVVPVYAPPDDDDDDYHSEAPAAKSPSQLPLPEFAPAQNGIRTMNPHPNPRQRVPFVWVKDWEWKPVFHVYAAIWRDRMFRLRKEGLPMDDYGSLELPEGALNQWTHMPVEVRRRRRLRKGEVVRFQNDRVMWYGLGAGEVEGGPYSRHQ